MRNNNDNSYLHNRTHWRRFKEMAKEIGEYEKINTSDYDFDNIVCYSMLGEDLNSDNVTYYTADGSSCFSNKEEYEIYEVANKANSSEFTFSGKFLLYARCVNYDYWLMSELIDKINYNETRKRQALIESVSVRPYGIYTVLPKNWKKRQLIRKIKPGRYATFSKCRRGATFDQYSIRRYAHSKLKNTDVLAMILHEKRKYTKIVGKDAVKIYKKNKKKRGK